MYDSLLFFGLNVPTNISYNYRLQWLNFIDIFCQVYFILINCLCSFIVMYLCRGLIIKIIVDCGLLLLTACYHEIEHTIKLPNEAVDFDIFSIPATYPLAPEIWDNRVCAPTNTWRIGAMKFPFYPMDPEMENGQIFVVWSVYCEFAPVQKNFAVREWLRFL